MLAGADAQSTSGLPPESLAARLLKAPVRAVYRRADRFVCIGRDLEREALRAGVPRERVHYLPHGVDHAAVSSAGAGERDAAARRTRLADRRPRRAVRRPSEPRERGDGPARGVAPATRER